MQLFPFTYVTISKNTACGLYAKRPKGRYADRYLCEESIREGWFNEST